MQVIHLNKDTFIDSPLVVTIGQFDGIHKAHQKLINQTVESAKLKNAKSAVITFNPHIDTVLRNNVSFNYIIDMPSKQEILENLNVDYLLIIEFNQDVAKISHQDFFKQYLNNLNILEFIIGFDFTYGHFGQGNSETIKDDYYKEVKVTKISKLEICNEKIGSSQIKNALENGNISKANDLLGFNFFMRFEITDTKDNKAYLNSLNLNILNKQNYNVSINNITSILYNEHKTYIENTFNQNIGDIIKVTFLN